MANQSSSMPASVGFVLALIGLLLFTQTVMGDAVARLLSYADPGVDPARDGQRGRVPIRGRVDKRSLSVGTIRADRDVVEMARVATTATGKRFVVISGYRPGAVVAGTDRKSCHAIAPGNGRGALDIKPKSGKPADCDLLEVELRRSPYPPSEIVWRGDSMHDPAAGAGSSWHLHAAWGCG